MKDLGVRRIKPRGTVVLLHDRIVAVGLHTILPVRIINARKGR